MSQRPRLAGDGRLTLPAKIAFDHHGYIRGRFSERTVDPFDWTEDRLLLAESFARLDLTDRRAVKQWWAAHGAIDLIDFFEGFGELPEEHDDWLEHRSQDAFIENRAEVAEEQANVSWHLQTLVRLSDHRDDRAWDPAWGEFILDSGGWDIFLIGGARAGARLWTDFRIENATRHAIPGDDRPDIRDAIALRASESHRPRVHVRPHGWYGYWVPEEEPADRYAEVELDPADVMRGSTWESALELERSFVEPYVARAVDRSFRIASEQRAEDGRVVLIPRETRTWVSILAPIYLQLFEALRRISEGEPGAATCRECGQPFLMLDARRRFFCNDRERFRHAQRERRRRLSATDSVAITDAASVEVVRRGRKR